MAVRPTTPRRRLYVVATLVLTGVGLLAIPNLPAKAWFRSATSAAAQTSTPTRGGLLYSTNFDPSTFTQTVVGSSASLTQGSGPSLVCSVGTAGSKLIASVKNWSVAEPSAIWAEYNVSLSSLNGGYVASFYFEGIGGNHRHLHIDFGNNQITLRDPNYQNEGPLVSVPGLSSGSTFQFVVVDESPRYRVFVNGTQVIDYTDSFAASTPGGFGLDCASQNNGTGSDAVTNFALYQVNDSCPAAWSCADIGGPKPSGTQTLSGTTWTIQGGGGDIWGSSDQFHYVWQTLGSRGGSVTAHVTAQGNTSAWAKAGVMLRGSTDPGAPDYQVLVTPGHGVVVQYRATQGGSGVSATTYQGTVPAYVGVGVSGTTFTAYTSTDGANWTAVPGSAKTLNLGSAVLAGMAVTSHNTSALSTVTMDSVAVSASQPGGPPPPPPPPPPPSSCPTGWSCADIGSPTPAGTQSLSGGTWTIQAGGSDIQSTADHFHYIWRSLSADGTISARVDAESTSSSWAKAGVMLRATSGSGSAYYAVFITPGNGVDVQYRSATSAGTSAFHVAGTAPIYLRIGRVGTTFTAYMSPDGTAWTAIPSSAKTLPSLSGSLLEGLAVTSHNTSVLCTATMDNVLPS